MIYRHSIYHAKLHKETTEWNMLLKPYSFAMWLWIFGGTYRKQFFIGIPSKHKLKGFQRLCQLQVVVSNFYLHHEAWFHWAISTGRASLNHSALAFPPVKLNKVLPFQCEHDSNCCLDLRTHYQIDAPRKCEKLSESTANSGICETINSSQTMFINKTLLSWILQQWPNISRTET